MKIAELFYSIQGEGKLAGVPSVLIRTSGCNLHCTWCDTPYASWSPEGEELTVDAILDRASDFPTQHVVLTGGEPLISPGVEELTHRLRDEGYHITIETAATVYRDVACDLASISPKLANSTPWERAGGRHADAHESRRMNLGVIRQCMAWGDYQLKFVVEHPCDLEEIDAVLAALHDYDPQSVLLMPQGVTADEIIARSRWIAEVCQTRGFRYCPRLQIMMYGAARGR